MGAARVEQAGSEGGAGSEGAAGRGRGEAGGGLVEADVGRCKCKEGTKQEVAAKLDVGNKLAGRHNCK